MGREVGGPLRRVGGGSVQRVHAPSPRPL